MSTDYATGSTLVTIKLVGGASVEVPMLSPAGVVEVAERLIERRKRQTLANAETAGFDKKALLKILNVLDTTPVRMGDVIEPIATDVWLQATVVEIAMRGREGTPDIVELPVAAAALLGCKLVEATKESGIDPFDEALNDASPSAPSTGTQDASAPSADATASQ